MNTKSIKSAILLVVISSLTLLACNKTNPDAEKSITIYRNVKLEKSEDVTKNNMIVSPSKGCIYLLPGSNSTGYLYNSALPTEDFEELASSQYWKSFNKTFSYYSIDHGTNGKNRNCIENQEAGDILFFQYTPQTRVILLVKSTSNNEILLDMIVEGKQEFLLDNYLAVR